MEKRTIQQIRGASELIGETVTATVTLVAKTHRAMARQPYALLSQIPAIARPVRLVEQIQNSIMDRVYSTILSANQIASAATTVACDQLEQRATRSQEDSA